MRKGAVALVAAANLVVVVGAVRLYSGGSSPAPATATTTTLSDWDRLDPQGRCDDAVALVRRPDPWPTLCTWREEKTSVGGQSFPPPVGDPPWDHPRIQIYVARTDSRVDVAHAIAHELGHMTHTRDFAQVPQWLAARGLPANTPWEVWTEDYAEVFAALFGPPVDGWHAPTTKPAPAALAALEAQFFRAG